jgi:hypothetical protein
MPGKFGGTGRWLLTTVVLLLCIPRTIAIARQTATLHVKVTIVDADRNTRPVPRHALLISENPTSAAPQRTVTSADGTAQINLRPGNYTVESDQPLFFQGKAYEWSQTLDVVAGRTSSLELTAAKAQASMAAHPPSSSTGRTRSSPSGARRKSAPAC